MKDIPFQHLLVSVGVTILFPFAAFAHEDEVSTLPYGIDIDAVLLTGVVVGSALVIFFILRSRLHKTESVQ